MRVLLLVLAVALVAVVGATVYQVRHPAHTVITVKPASTANLVPGKLPRYDIQSVQTDRQP
jgi:hypothetical protein